MSDQKNEQKRVTFAKSFAMVAEFGFAIVIPLLIFGYLGKWLERTYDTKLLLIACIAVAIITSSAWLYWRILDIYEDFKQL